MCFQKVRVAAVQCLGMLTTLPHHILFPYQSQVTRTLGKVVDDHKRMVRHEAVQARNEWSVLPVKHTKINIIANMHFPPLPH